jgi:hypothetical protein
LKQLIKDGQAIQWPKEEGQTIQWPQGKGQQDKIRCRNKVRLCVKKDILETVKAKLNSIRFISSDASIKLHARKNGLTNQLTLITANNMELYRIQQLLSVISVVLETVVIQT